MILLWQYFDCFGAKEFEKFRELLIISISAQGSSGKRPFLTVSAHVDRSLRGYGPANICRKQLGTVLNASPCVLDRKMLKTHRKSSKINDFHRNSCGEEGWFHTVKVAKNLHTALSRYPREVPCVRSMGIGTPPSQILKVTKIHGVAAFVVQNGQKCVFFD